MIGLLPPLECASPATECTRCGSLLLALHHILWSSVVCVVGAGSPEDHQKAPPGPLETHGVGQEPREVEEVQHVGGPGEAGPLESPVALVHAEVEEQHALPLIARDRHEVGDQLVLPTAPDDVYEAAAAWRRAPLDHRILWSALLFGRPLPRAQSARVIEASWREPLPPIRSGCSWFARLYTAPGPELALKRARSTSARLGKAAAARLFRIGLAITSILSSESRIA